MRVFLFFLLTAVPLAGVAQQMVIPEVSLPALPGKAANAAGFAPKGWKVQRQAAGDLNGDGRPDLAFVLQQTDPRNVVKNGKDSLGSDEVDTNPRILCVAFHDAAGDGYTLVMHNARLIPRWTEPTQEDNFGEEGGLDIKRGAFTVSLHYFANAGGWDMGSTEFTFRFQHGRFELIGYSNENHARNTGIDTVTSANYSTGQVKVVTSGDSIPTRTRLKRLPAKPLLGIDQVGDGMEFALK